MELQFHEAANLFPIDDENLSSLADDIKENGLRCPVELYEGKVIDGRRRSMACKIAGVKPDYVDVKPDDPVAYVLSLNLHRRHMTPSQLAMVAARVRKIYDDAAEARMKSGKKDPPVNLPEGKADARDAAGKSVGVSGKSVDFASKVLKTAEPEIIKAVDDGRMAVSTAAVYASEPPEVQKQIAAEPKRQRSYKSIAKKNRSSKSTVESEPEKHGVQGKGVRYAHEAIACLKKIPRNDALRRRGFEIVSDYIKANR